MPKAKRISFAEGKQILDTNHRAILLDVRTEEEYAAAHAAGALLLTLEEITADTAAEVIPADADVLILYCRTGRRSALAADILAELGYDRIFDLGGLNGWPYGFEYGI